MNTNTPPFTPPFQPDKPWQRRNYQIAVALILLVLIGLGILFAMKNDKKESDTGSKDAAIQKIAQRPATETFLDYFKNAARQEQVSVTKEVKRFDTSQSTSEPAEVIITKAWFDYKTKRYALAEDILVGFTGKSRCNNEREYVKLSIEREWREKVGQRQLGACMPRLLSLAINDGVNTGGLSAEQAQAFVDYLKKKEGLLRVKDVTVVKHKGKEYLRYSVQFGLVAWKSSITNEVDYSGKEYIETAFLETGLDPDTHMYQVEGASADGILLEYYVDPKKQLPVYSELRVLPGEDSDGKTRQVANTYVDRVVYQFGVPTFDITAYKDVDLKFDW